MEAALAQLVEQLIRNQQIVSSSLTSGSRNLNEQQGLASNQPLFFALTLHPHAHLCQGAIWIRPLGAASQCNLQDFLAGLAFEDETILSCEPCGRAHTHNKQEGENLS